jgi:hypothetical protein
VKLLHFLRRGREAADLNEEMRLHLDLRARRLAEEGTPEPEARMAARRQFGNPAALLDASAAQWGWQSWERLAQDIRQACRTLRKSPAFAAVAVLTLGLGLGVNTAVFSVVNGVMLRPLPYAEPARLVALWEENSRSDLATFNSSGARIGTPSPRRTTVSVANLADYRRLGVFDSVAAYQLTSANLTGSGDAERVNGEFVEPQFFATLGIEPQIGRSFLAEEDRPGADGVVVLTHAFWQRRLGGDPNALDRSIVLDGRPRRVVGVLPEGFRSPLQLATPAQTIEYYVPPSIPAALLISRGDHEVNVIGRLKPGVSSAAAQTALDTISAGLSQRFPDSNRGMPR